MSKAGKIFLGIGGAILLLIIIFCVGAVRYFNESGTSSYSYPPSIADDTTQNVRGGMALGIANETVPAPGRMEKAVVAEVSVNNAPQAAKIDRLIIKTGELSMVVKDVKVGLANIGNYAEKNGGFVVSSDLSKEGVAPYGEIVVRIPSDIFDKGLAQLKGLGEVKSEKINGQDVTEEYVDLTSQLKNLQATEVQFLAIMRQAVKIQDILDVQNELTNVRGQIESIQGRMKYLEQSSKLSTLTFYLSTDPDVLPTVDAQNQWKPWGEVKAAARGLLEVGKGLVSIIIWLVIYIPLWIVLGLIVWGIIKLIKKIRNKK